MRLACLSLAALAFSAVPAAAKTPRPLAVAELVHADGSPAGTARILPQSEGAALELELTGIAPGVHGLHLHAVGQCAAPGFTSAGGHINPDDHQHGIRNPAGTHLGDLPNVTAGRDGRVSARIRTPMRPFRLISNLFDKDGAAIVLHADADDYLTDPSGNSGARIACGVFQRP